MRKVILVQVIILSVLQSWAQTIQIGNGASNQRNIPVFTNTMYSYSQQIITKDELIQSGYDSTFGNITRLRYHFNNQTSFLNSKDWIIYIGHTSKTSFSSDFDWEAITNFTIVFADTINRTTPKGWMDIFLQTPFLYDGISNIIIAIDENTYYYTPSSAYYSSYPDSSNKGIFCVSWPNPAIDIDPNNPPSGTLVSTLPSVQFYFQESCSAPSNLKSEFVNATEAQISWTPQGTETLWNLRYKSDNDSIWTVVNDVVTPHYTIVNLFSFESYIVQVQANCIGLTSEWVNSISFTTPPIAGMQYSVDWEIYNYQFVNDYSLMDSIIPSHIIRLDSLNTPNHSTGMDNFLSGIRGYILPRVSGNYSFYFACDNVGQFWLSPDASEENAQLKSNVLFAQDDWNQNVSLQEMVAGEKYFFKILHYDSVYTDNIKLGWKMPNDTVVKTIKFPYLSSCGNNISPVSLSILSDSIVGYPDYTRSLIYRFSPWNTTNKSIKWTSTNTSIATVDSNGLVTLVNQGNCTIIGKLVADTTITANVNVTVWDYYGPFFVKANASIFNDGKSWENAIDFQKLLGVLNTLQGNRVVNVYISEGVYKPTSNLDRNISFVLNNTRIAGGFSINSSGTDTTMRDILNHETILSGEIGVPDETLDNSYHVVIAKYSSTIDGFTIRDGRASCSSYGFIPGFYQFRQDNSGGGVYIPGVKSNIFIKDCKITNNSAWNSGGGICCKWSSLNIHQSTFLTIENCSLSDNIIEQVPISTGGIFVIIINGQGAGITMYTSTLNAINCRFFSNTSLNNGKAIYLENAAANLESCSIFNNIGDFDDLYEVSASVLNVNNTSIKGSLSGHHHSNINIFNTTITGGGDVGEGNNSVFIDNSIWAGMSLSQITDTCQVKYSILGNSLFGANKYNIVSDVIPNYSLWLDTLAYNGGPTPTMKLKNIPGNYALNYGNPLYLDSTDQRGAIRANYVSIGAYQWVDATEIVISPNQLTLTQGDSIDYEVYFLPAFSSDGLYAVSCSDNSIALVDSSTIYAIKPGFVNIIAQSVDGTMRDTLICQVIANAGIEEVNQIKSFKVYPNPVENELIIQSKGLTGMVSFEILNNSGHVVSKGLFTGQGTVNTSNLCSGLYLIKCTIDKKTELVKFIKK